MLRMLSFAVAVAACVCGSPASADFFKWSYSGTTPNGAAEFGQGVLTTTGTTADGGLIITSSYGGWWNGVLFHTFVAVEPRGVIYPFSDPVLGSFNFFGDSVRGDAGAGYGIIIEPTSDGRYGTRFTAIGFCCGYGPIYSTGEFTLTETWHGVPGPLAGAGLPGFIAGLAGLVAWRRNRSQRRHG